MKLEEKLSQFKGAANESELQKMFKELAPAFLYGGYTLCDIGIHRGKG